MGINTRKAAVMSLIMAFLPICTHALNKQTGYKQTDYKQVDYKHPVYKDLSPSRLPSYLQDAEVAVGIGPAFYRVNKGHIIVTRAESDTLDPGNIPVRAEYRIGAGYYIFKHYFTPDSFFTSLLAELNLYHSSIVIKGVVLQDGQSDLDNYTFRAPFNSTALMLDFKPGFLPYKNFSPYAILGLGVAWNQIAYRDSPSESDIPNDSFIALATRTKQDFAYDLGLGIRYAIDKHYSCSLEYIYSHLGNAQPNSTPALSESAVNILITPTFTLYTQTVLFNFIYNF
jgi:opacity protein-like surface antigen